MGLLNYTSFFKPCFYLFKMRSLEKESGNPEETPEQKQERIRSTIPEFSNPSELASFYNNGATSEQKKYIEWLLTKYPERYQKETSYFITHPEI